MAFDVGEMSHVGGSSPAPRLYTYNTEDTRLVVLTAGYFNSAYTKLQVKDLIIVNNSSEVYTCKVTAVGNNSVTVEKSSMLDREHAFYYLPAQENVSIPNDGVTYATIPNKTGAYLHHFNVLAGVLTYVGPGGDFLFNGSTDISCDNSMDITITMFINGVAGQQSVVTSFPNANKRRQSASTGMFSLVNGDEIDVRVKGDGTPNATLAVFSMNLTFLEL